MEIAYPVYVLDRDGEVARFASEKDFLGQLEAIDVEDREYDAWDSNGQILDLQAHGVGTWSSGTIAILPTGKIADSTRFAEIQRLANAKNVPR